MASRISPVVVRFSPDELAEVRARARDADEPLARYLRQVALGHTPGAQEADLYDDLVRSLNDVTDALDRAEGSDLTPVLRQLRDVLAAVAKKVGSFRQVEESDDDAALG